MAYQLITFYNNITGGGFKKQELATKRESQKWSNHLLCFLAIKILQEEGFFEDKNI